MSGNVSTALGAEARKRVQRSELAVPATASSFLDSAARCGADSVFFDLEDAVAPARKEEARAMAAAALNEVEWGSQLMGLRINALDTEWWLADLTTVVPGCARLDVVVLPKVGSAHEVQVVDTVLTALEREHRRERPVGLEVLVETPLGLANVEAIAAASDRLEAIIFGIGDYAIAMKTFDLNIGAPHAWYAVPVADDGRPEPTRHWNDQWHFALARIANACRAYGLRSIDGPYANYADLEGYRASAERAAVLGFEGKWAVHPTQVPIANEVFTPSPEQVGWARALLDDLGESVEGGRAAFGRDGRLIDLAHEKQARSILERSEAVERADAAKPAAVEARSRADA
jgi:malyl-CoA/(S)-citramalyl-CoA lyase